MGFSDNLRNLRREKNLSQEQLAELLNVSRQSVSKWEQDNSYPETEKLIQLAQKLDISLDALLLDRQPADVAEGAMAHCSASSQGERKITIRSYCEDTISTYFKFTISANIFAGKNEPKYVLYGIDKISVLGANLVTLGWYKTKEDAQKELDDIYTAMLNWEPSYELKYTAKVTRKAFGVKLISEDGQ